MIKLRPRAGAPLPAKASKGMCPAARTKAGGDLPVSASSLKRVSYQTKPAEDDPATDASGIEDDYGYLPDSQDAASILPQRWFSAPAHRPPETLKAMDQIYHHAALEFGVLDEDWQYAGSGIGMVTQSTAFDDDGACSGWQMLLALR